MPAHVMEPTKREAPAAMRMALLPKLISLCLTGSGWLGSIPVKRILDNNYVLLVYVEGHGAFIPLLDQIP